MCEMVKVKQCHCVTNRTCCVGQDFSLGSVRRIRHFGLLDDTWQGKSAVEQLWWKSGFGGIEHLIWDNC